MTESKKPSEAETAILSILWERQPCLVKDIHDELSQTKDVGYTTTLKQVQRLFEKGLVTRTPGPGKSFLYSASIGEDETRSRLLNRFVETAFGNSVSELVMHALGNADPNPSELAQIRALLDSLEKDNSEQDKTTGL